MADQHQIFKQGSTTYYYSSRLFPRAIREDVTTLYAFVRTADDLVDTVPQQEDEFQTFTEDTLRSFDGEDVNRPVIEEFVELCQEKDIKQDWVEAFLHSMEMDLERSSYETIDDLKEYIYGSAEVIGLMLCQILGVDEKAHEQARLQGRAMQYINFLRDIDEDNGFGRQYIPTAVLEEHGLDGLAREEAEAKPDTFRSMIRAEIGRYRDWQEQAREGYDALPLRARLPVRTASRLYGWTADVIEDEPFIVYEETVKPSRLRVAREAIGSVVRL